MIYKILSTLLLLMVISISAQSKSETIDWLNNKLSSSPIGLEGSMETTFFAKYNTDGSFENTLSEESKLINYLSISKFSGNLSKLDPQSIRIIKSNDGNYFLQATCTKGKCITQNSKYENGKTAQYNSSIVSLAYVSDTELAVRCRTAFIHLIHLQGGKKELF